MVILIRFSNVYVDLTCLSLDFLKVNGTDGTTFALGDCTATSYAPTAQVASQQGAYLARCFHQIAKKDNLAVKLEKLEQSQGNASSPEEQKKLDDEISEVRKKLAKSRVRPFQYSHQGSLAYIGSEKAIADLPFMNGNVSVQKNFESEKN